MTRTLLTDRTALVADVVRRRLDGARHKAGTIAGAYRRRGVAGVAVAVAGHLPRRVVSIEWYQVLESVPPGDPTLAPWPDTRIAGPDDLDALVAVGQADRDDIAQRLRDGDRAYIAYDDGEPISYLWFRAHRWREDDTEFVLDDDERWAYDSFVHPDHRGRRIAPAVTVHALVELQREGIHRVVSVIDHLNDASLRAARRYGAHPVGSFMTIRLPGLTVVHERPTGSRRATWKTHRGSTPIVRRPPPSPTTTHP